MVQLDRGHDGGRRAGARAGEPGLIIPYGCSRWQDGWITTGADGSRSCAVPHVVIDPAASHPLRLHDGPYSMTRPQRGGAQAELARIEEYLLGRADPWSKAGRGFLVRYFDHIRRRVADEREALSARLEAFGGLFDPAAFAFAAPRPLPRAYLPAGDAMIAVQCAFWIGDRAVVIEIETADSDTPKQREARALLADDGALVIRAAPDAPIGEIGLPPVFAAFWEGIEIPSGPFKARGIEAYLTPQISSSST